MSHARQIDKFCRTSVVCLDSIYLVLWRTHVFTRLYLFIWRVTNEASIKNSVTFLCCSSLTWLFTITEFKLHSVGIFVNPFSLAVNRQYSVAVQCSSSTIRPDDEFTSWEGRERLFFKLLILNNQDKILPTPTRWIVREHVR